MPEKEKKASADGSAEALDNMLLACENAIMQTHRIFLIDGGP
jgi:hypothetical protein